MGPYDPADGVPQKFLGSDLGREVGGTVRLQLHQSVLPNALWHRAERIRKYMRVKLAATALTLTACCAEEQQKHSYRTR